MDGSSRTAAAVTRTGDVEGAVRTGTVRCVQFGTWYVAEIRPRGDGVDAEGGYGQEESAEEVHS